MKKIAYIGAVVSKETARKLLNNSKKVPVGIWELPDSHIAIAWSCKSNYLALDYAFKREGGRRIDKTQIYFGF